MGSQFAPKYFMSPKTLAVLGLLLLSFPVQAGGTREDVAQLRAMAPGRVKRLMHSVTGKRAQGEALTSEIGKKLLPGRHVIVAPIHETRPFARERFLTIDHTGSWHTVEKFAGSLQEGERPSDSDLAHVAATPSELTNKLKTLRDALRDPRQGNVAIVPHKVDPLAREITP
jgi:hypothetical protein